mgnify:CR=1 FL=1
MKDSAGLIKHIGVVQMKDSAGLIKHDTHDSSSFLFSATIPHPYGKSMRDSFNYLKNIMHQFSSMKYEQKMKQRAPPIQTLKSIKLLWTTS